MLKRILSLLVVITLVCSMVPMAYASESITYGIEPQYESSGVFFEGLAAVQKGGKWGFIDKSGAVVVPFQYDTAQQFSGGLAVVGLMKDGQMKFGYINAKGQEVTSIEYDDAGYGSDGFAHVTMKGKQSGSIYGSDVTRGLVGLQGEIIPPIYESVGAVQEGMIVVKQDGMYGYFDSNGKAVTKFIYTDANSFTNGLGRVYQKAKSGFIDRTGTTVIPLDNRSYGDYHEGLAAVRIDGKYGYIDTFGTMIVKPKYEDAWYFNNGLAPVKFGGKHGFIDQTGKTVVPFRYDETSYTFTNGLARVAIGEDYYLESSEGQYFEGQARQLSTKKYGYVNMQGEEVVPLKYDYAEEFLNGFAKVGIGGVGSYNEGGKFGYVDATGKEVVAPIYDFVGGDIGEGFIGMREGMSPVSNGGSGRYDEYEGGKWGYVDGTGQEIVPLIYDKTYPFRAGLGMVRKDGKIGFVDKTGQLVIPAIYDDATVFMNGYAQVQLGSKAGFAAADGSAADIRFDAIRPFREGLAAVEDSNGRKGFLRNPLPALSPVKIDIATRSDGGPATVTLSHPDPDAVILYTTDGSQPHTYISAYGTNEYTKPFRLYESVTIKAVAIARGKQDSSLSVTEYKHTFKPLKPAADQDAEAPAKDGSASSGNIPANKSGFTDVADSHWASKSIKWAASQGIASGYGDGKFRPDASVTEPEFLTMLLRSYPDIKVPAKAAGASWSAPYYEVSKSYNWPVLNGKSGTSFNRGQVALLLAASQGFEFREMNDAIQYVLDIGIAGGKTSPTVAGFGSNDHLKRSEAITLIHNLKDRGFKLAKAEIVPDTMPKEFQVGGISIGDTEATVLARLGQPARKDQSEFGFTWYIYNADYTRYMQVGVMSGKVVGLFSNTDTWKSNRGLKLGASTADIEKRYGTGRVNISKGSSNETTTFYLDDAYRYLQDGSYLTVYLDKHDGNKATAIQLIDQAVEEKMSKYYGKETVELRESFERQSLDLVNAFRVRYGLNALRWDETTAGAARAHSEDMRDRDFFDHVNPDGKDPGNRMEAAGIPYRAFGENIAGGQRDAIEAYQSWVNSKGHRDNMLRDQWTHLGVGVAFNPLYPRSPFDLGMFYTQNFYSDSGASAGDTLKFQNDQQSQGRSNELRNAYKNDGGAFELYVVNSHPQPDGSTVNDYGLRNTASITLPPFSAIYVATGSNYVKFEDDYYNFNFGGNLVVANHTDKPMTVPAGSIQFPMQYLYRDNGGTVTLPDGKSLTLKSTGPYVRMIAFDGDFDEAKEYKTYMDDKKVIVAWDWREVTARAK